jgi:hypothetical protein
MKRWGGCDCDVNKKLEPCGKFGGKVGEVSLAEPSTFDCRGHNQAPFLKNKHTLDSVFLTQLQICQHASVDSVGSAFIYYCVIF